MTYIQALKETAARMFKSWKGVAGIVDELKTHVPNVLFLLLQLFFAMFGPVLVIFSPLLAFSWKANADSYERNAKIGAQPDL